MRIGPLTISLEKRRFLKEDKKASASENRRFPRNAGAFELRDPSKNRVFRDDQSGEVTPSDVAVPDAEKPTVAAWQRADAVDAETEGALVAYVLQCFKEAAQARRGVERDWVLALAMLDGRQWLAWDDAHHRAVNLMDEDERDRYVTDNLIAPLLLKWTALVTMTRPDAGPAPDTDSPQDRQAAGEARAILAHLDRRHCRQTQTVERVQWTGSCGVSWLKTWWDKNAEADVPQFGPDGQVAGKFCAPVGEVDEEVIPPFEVYLDPGAKRWRDVRWLVHACTKPLSWFQARFGDRGFLVEPDAQDAGNGWVDSYLLAAPENAGNNRQAKAQHAVCYEFWERPTPKYPHGRFVIVAGKRVLFSGPWPCTKRHDPNNPFPFVRLVHAEAFGHPYGKGLVPQLAPLQVAYNRLLTKALTRVEDDKATLLVPKGSEIGVDAYEETGRNHHKVYYEEGAGPASWQQMPPVGADLWRLRDVFWTDMQHIAGIHEVQMGGTPSGVTAGISIELLQQGDRTQMAVMLQGIEQSAVHIGDWEISLYGQYAAGNLPRLMGLDNTGNPEMARSAATSFRALSGGGSCSMIVMPGSATPKTPAGQKQEVLEYYRLGLFGPAGDPQSAAMAVKLLALARSDEVLEHLQQLQARLAASQPAPPDGGPPGGMAGGAPPMPGVMGAPAPPEAAMALGGPAGATARGTNPIFTRGGDQ